MQATWKGPGGLTPLHLAALLPNGEAMAMQLCITFGAKQWLTAATDDGFTPAQFAIKAGKRALTQAVTSTALEQRTSVTDEAPEVIRSKPMVPSSQKRACPAESISVVPKKQKAADAWTSSTSSDNSGSSSSSGEEDSCMSEPHVFSQLSGMPVGAAQDGLVGFLQGQRQRLAALCRRSGWTPFNVGSVQW